MLVDTNILIAYLNGEPKVLEAFTIWRKEGGVLYLSSVVEAELFSFPGANEEEVEKMGLFLQESFVFIPFERQIARLTGKLRREKKMKLADAAIAATALYLGTPLITRNKKDFRVKGLVLIDWL